MLRGSGMRSGELGGERQGDADTHALFVLKRAHTATDTWNTRVAQVASGLAPDSSTARRRGSEQMDEDPGWHNLRPGELLHVDSSLKTTRRVIHDKHPRGTSSPSTLGARAGASQAENRPILDKEQHLLTTLALTRGWSLQPSVL